MQHWWNVVDREVVEEYSASLFRVSNYLFIYFFIYLYTCHPHSHENT
jgi:TRAP-type mannitol/chloroaromatic compound transport system permease small subunit